MRKKIPLILTVFLFVQLNAQKKGFAESTGVRIYYRTFGKGVPVLIINGGPGLNSDGFEDLAKNLSLHNQTIIYDQRGTGKSVLKKSDTSTVTMKLMVDDIENLRRHLHIQKWIILGHSFGGMLASFYATRHPESILAMILSSSGGIDLDLLSYVSKSINSKLTATQIDSVNYWNQKINGGDTSYFANLQRAKILANAYVFDKKYAPAIAIRLARGNMQINGLIWQDMEKINFNCAEKLSLFKKPVLIIQGKQDIIAEKTAKKAHKVLKNSTVIFLDHSVHYGWLDNREKYFTAVETFITADYSSL